jgi:hypothetical protein
MFGRKTYTWLVLRSACPTPISRSDPSSAGQAWGRVDLEWCSVDAHGKSTLRKQGDPPQLGALREGCWDVTGVRCDDGISTCFPLALRSTGLLWKQVFRLVVRPCPRLHSSSAHARGQTSGQRLQLWPTKARYLERTKAAISFEAWCIGQAGSG